jgi:hypothetical protein
VVAEATPLVALPLPPPLIAPDDCAALVPPVAPLLPSKKSPSASPVPEHAAPSAPADRPISVTAAIARALIMRLIEGS